MKKFKELDFDKNGNGLIPAIIQDDKSMKVLMLGYMSRGSLALTLEKGLVTFYSRSRKVLWTKGETSGNYLKVVSIDTDCDGDTLLIKVEPAGNVCHKGTFSCFGEEVQGEETKGEVIRELALTIKERHENMPEGSYTSRLFSGGACAIAQKVGEEAVEVVIEAVKGDDERLRYELADLLYHTLVLMEEKGISITEIEEELFQRRDKKELAKP
jgi:phosphoribosyl-ATP pyrophosphohydrolase/phosphoribosyl-AMP cyclohydrolase